MRVELKRITRVLSVTSVSIAIILPATTLAQSPQITPNSLDARSFPIVQTIDERYQSFQIGFSHLTGGDTWKSYETLDKEGQTAASGGFEAVREARTAADLNDPRLVNLTRALGPLYIRFSGTSANSAYFHNSDTPPPASPPSGFITLLTRKAWKGAVDFTKAVDAKIVTSFANSEGVRDASGTWTPKMAAPWLAYTGSIGGEIYAAELWNEPNAKEPPRLPEGIAPADFARHFAAFRAYMSKAAPSMKIAGPGTVFLGVGEGGVTAVGGIDSEMYVAAKPTPKFDIVSYHFYPALAQRCAPENSPMGIASDKALSEDWLARPSKSLAAQVALRDRIAPGAPIWLTETGGAACGGVRWQQTFLDAFRYLDTLSRSAKEGLDAIFTHALISGSNGVIDEKTFQPNASYWGALLWRQLMGTKVLDAGQGEPGLKLYAHCQRNTRGSVTVLALNLGSDAKILNVAGPANVYALTNWDMASKTALLNGKTLAVNANGMVPTMKPVRVKKGQVNLSPTSINFITLPQARNPVCES